MYKKKEENNMKEAEYKLSKGERTHLSGLMEKTFVARLKMASHFFKSSPPIRRCVICCVFKNIDAERIHMHFF
jgi:hypothetical protein